MPHIAAAAAVTDPGVSPYPNLSYYSHEELTRTWYDDYNWVTSPPPGMPTPFAASDADFNPHHNSHLLANTSFPYAQQPAKDPENQRYGNRHEGKKAGNGRFYLHPYDL